MKPDNSVIEDGLTVLPVNTDTIEQAKYETEQREINATHNPNKHYDEPRWRDYFTSPTITNE